MLRDRSAQGKSFRCLSHAQNDLELREEARESLIHALKAFEDAGIYIYILHSNYVDLLRSGNITRQVKGLGNPIVTKNSASWRTTTGIP